MMNDLNSNAYNDLKRKLMVKGGGRGDSGRSPALDECATSPKLVLGHGLGEDVGSIELTLTVLDLDLFTEMGTKPMILDGDVLGARRHVRGIRSSESKTSLIVLENGRNSAVLGERQRQGSGGGKIEIA